MFVENLYHFLNYTFKKPVCFRGSQIFKYLIIFRKCSFDINRSFFASVVCKCAFVSMCVYACTFVCMHCMCVCMHVFVYVCVYLSAQVFL